MKTVKLSDFSPYDRNKGGIQELHHKIESKILQYWGEDSGILIGITPIYKRRLWSKEVNVIMINNKYENKNIRRGAARRLGKMCLMWSTNASSMWS